LISASLTAPASESRVSRSPSGSAPVAAAKRIVKTMSGSSAPSAAAANGRLGRRLAGQRQEDLHDRHAHQHADRAGRREKEQGETAQLTEAPEVAQRTHPDEDHDDHQRDDHHLQQVDEGLADGLDPRGDRHEPRPARDRSD
jgi:hypothetical protein